MNTYRITMPDGAKGKRDASDIRALLAVLTLIEGQPEPIKIELVKK